MKTFKQFIFENKNNDIIVYHGGDKLTNSDIKNNGLFTTPDKNGAMWFVQRKKEIGEIGWLTKLKVIINNPLTDKNKEDFKKNWIPILNDANIEYEFEEEVNGVSWSFQCDEILTTGKGSENNIWDLLYIDRFLKTAIKFGFDGMIGYDVLEMSEILIYVPFLKKNINIISSEKILDHELNNWFNKYNQKEFENKYQDHALDKLSKIGSFPNLPTIDKLALLSNTDDIQKLKNLSLTKIYKELGGTFEYLQIKVKVLPVSEQKINHKFSKEKANQTGYLFPGIHYSDNNESYVTVRFKFIPNTEMKGGGTYEGIPIMLDNIYPIEFNDTPQEFILYRQKIEAERKEFLDNWKGLDSFDDK
jgi:hypothetical protein